MPSALDVYHATVKERNIRLGRRPVAGPLDHAFGDLALARHDQAGAEASQMLDGCVGMGARQDIERRIEGARLLDHLDAELSGDGRDVGACARLAAMGGGVGSGSATFPSGSVTFPWPPTPGSPGCTTFRISAQPKPP